MWIQYPLFTILPQYTNRHHTPLSYNIVFHKDRMKSSVRQNIKIKIFIRVRMKTYHTRIEIFMRVKRKTSLTLAWLLANKKLKQVNTCWFVEK